MARATNLTEEQDRLIWKGERKGEFTVRSAYRELRLIEEQQAGWPWRMIWRTKIPYKVNYFAWLLAKEEVLTHENLNKRKHNLCSRCYLCEEQEKRRRDRGLSQHAFGGQFGMKGICVWEHFQNILSMLFSLAAKISDPFQIEIEANITTPRVIEAELVLNPGTFAEAYNDRVATEEQVDDNAISIINTKNKENMEIHTGGYLQLKEKEEGNDTLEDILPLNSAEDEGIMDHKNMIPTWVQQNIIKLSKEFGVHFQGCEKVALNLFMKINGKRQVTGEAPGAIVPVTPKEKIPKELKNQEPSSKFISFGTRSSGGCFVNNLNEG
ncbi:hypothetical protein MTR67_012346 [Solanum verrucosum]|uniref:Reverse transcriptase zinc-binding domain-containing protein n=1 Tax=Solanum verrucosum TaxID=315347 RepID=A0AAF0Q8Q9_SOLVR|nr:hypothetical protein MTR67_012346 [Solanum verrucosum]